MQMKVSWCRRVDLPGVILVFSEISNALLTRTRSAALKQLNSCPLPSFLFRSPQRSAPLCVCFLAGVSSPTTPETRDASSRKFLLKLFFQPTRLPLPSRSPTPGALGSRTVIFAFIVDIPRSVLHIRAGRASAANRKTADSVCR